MALESGDSAPFVIEPIGLHQNTIILFHGRGSGGPEFVADLFDDDCNSDGSKHTKQPGETKPATTPPDPDNVRGRLPHWRWVFPSAPMVFSTVFQENNVEWFDCFSLTDTEARKDLQAPGLRTAVLKAFDLFRSESRRLPATGRLVVGGISQGAAIAVHALLASYAMARPEMISGFVGYSTWLPFTSEVQGVVDGQKTRHETREIENGLRSMYGSVLGLDDESDSEGNAGRHARLRGVPALLEHCKDDDLIDIALGRTIRDVLGGLGLDVSWKEYETGGHWLKEPEGMEDLVAFLKRVESSTTAGHPVQ